MRPPSLRAFLFGAAVGLLTALAPACGGTNESQCDASNCTGCCDAEGACQLGVFPDACGVTGNACSACASGQMCNAGYCMAQCKGQGSSCAGNDCCAGLTCNAGACVPQTCAAGGAVCTSNGDCCSGQCTSGTCTEPPTECSNITGDRATQVCLRWRCDRMNRHEGTWTGDASTCSPGDNERGRTNALKMVNLQRFLAGLPEVSHDPVLDAKAQACAVLMHANGTITHTPPSAWLCYTDDGSEAAGKSNLATAPGVMSVDLYMVDSGNATTLGHRRWILSNQLGPIGLGTTDEFSCLYVLGGQGASARQWTAWPPEGPFPLEGFAPDRFSSINETGWSIQSETINLQSVQVTVTDDGVDLPVTVTPLSQGYGSKYALRFNPNGWLPQAGHTYQVKVIDPTTLPPSPVIQYEVQVVDCGK